MGVFQIDRDIFDNSIWNNPKEFRLFFYILGNAVWKEDGIDKGDIHVERGQFLRSYRKLQEDLMYIENHSVKYYSLSTIKKIIEKLEKEGRIKTKSTELGTLFTVVNYGIYQGFERYSEQPPRTLSEHWSNTERTLSEHWSNNKKKENKENKDNTEKNVAASVSEKISQKSQSENLDADEISKAFSSLKNGFPNIKDEMLITETLKSFSKDDILKVIDEQIGKGKTIKSFAYIKAVLEGRRKDKKEFKARLKPKNVYLPEDEEPVIEAPETKEELRAKELDLLEQSKKYQKEFEKFRRQK